MNMMECELSKRLASISIACKSCECIRSNYNELVVIKLNSPYICICKKEIKTECQYWKHLCFKKDLLYYKCCVCEMYFTQKMNLLGHMAIHTDLKRPDGWMKYSCQFCNAKFLFFRKLAFHVFVNGIGNPFECSICHNFFKTKCALTEHENFVHSRHVDFCLKKDSKCLKCCVCRNPFTRQFDLIEHIVEKHAGFIVYECQHCEEVFSSFDTLSSHVSANGVGNQKECPSCHEVFESKCALVKHDNGNHTKNIGSACNKILKTNAEIDETSTISNPCVSIPPNLANPSHGLGNTTVKNNISESDSPYSPSVFQPHDLQENPIYFSPISPHSTSQLYHGQSIKVQLWEESGLYTENDSSSIPCRSCECHFSKYDEFAIHHFQCSYTCVCQKEIQTECEYWQHFSVKDSTLFKCCICNNYFPRLVDIMQHIRERHANLLKYACPHCKEEFFCFNALASHVCVNGACSHNECRACHKVFESKCALVKHENTSHTGIAGSTSKKSLSSNTHTNQKEKQNAKNRERSENATSSEFSNTIAIGSSCRTDSSYFAPDLQQYLKPQHVTEYPIHFLQIHPHDSLQLHPVHAFQSGPKSIQPIFRSEVIHDMNYNMSYNSPDDMYQNEPPNPIQQCQQNGSHPF